MDKKLQSPLPNQLNFKNKFEKKMNFKKDHKN
jgi:hypothetical protein